MNEPANGPKTTKIALTTALAHVIKAGDVVEVTRLDHRWWRRLWFWLLRRGAPTITTRHAVARASQHTLDL